MQIDNQLALQYSPQNYYKLNYGTKIQYARQPDKLQPTTKTEMRQVQSITCTFLYYSRAIDPTMMVALNDSAAIQSKPTHNMLTKCNCLLMDYATTYPNAKLRYFASNMVLHVNSNTTSFVQNNVRS